MVSVEQHKDAVSKSQDVGNNYSWLGYDEIKSQFAQLSPAKINQACAAWSQLASSLGSHADSMMSEFGTPLHEAWQSATSPDVQKHLQTAQATAQALANQCMHMARATDFAYQYATWYQQHLPGTGSSQGAEDDGYAQEHLVKFMDRYNEVIAFCLPDSVQADFVQTKPGDGNKDNFRVSGKPGTAPGALPSTGHTPGGLPSQHAPTTPPIHSPPTLPRPHGPTTTQPDHTGPGGSVWPNHSNGPGGLASVPPAGIDTGSSLAGFDGGAGSNSGGLGAVGSDGGVAGASAGLGGAAPAGSGGIGSDGAGIGAAGAGAGQGGRGMMAPMHGGGPAGEEERERSTWLVEDEDVWGVRDAPPPVIGG